MPIHKRPPLKLLGAHVLLEMLLYLLPCHAVVRHHIVEQLPVRPAAAAANYLARLGLCFRLSFRTALAPFIVRLGLASHVLPCRVVVLFAEATPFLARQRTAKACFHADHNRWRWRCFASRKALVSRLGSIASPFRGCFALTAGLGSGTLSRRCRWWCWVSVRKIRVTLFAKVLFLPQVVEGIHRELLQSDQQMLSTNSLEAELRGNLHFECFQRSSRPPKLKT